MGRLLALLLLALTLAACGGMPGGGGPATSSSAATSAPTATSSPAGLTLEQQVGQMLMVGFRGVTLDEPAAQLLRDIAPGGVVLYDRDGPSGGEVARNITDPEQLRALTARLQDTAAIPYFIAIDAEGGYVNRLKEKYGFGVKAPTALELGRQSPANTAAVAGALAGELRAAGINWNLAPVVDVNIDPDSPAIGKWERSFSADPAAVAAHAAAFIDAHRERGVITALKHFPGHGSAGGDTHLGVTDVTDTYRRDAELAPYSALIGGGYGGPVMTAHIVNRNLDAAGRPATLSADIMTGLLRAELGFGGVVVSDDMQMGAIVAEYGLAEAAVAAVNAGVDIVLLANQQGDYDPAQVYQVRDALAAAVADGTIPQARIADANERIRRLKEEYGIIR